MPRERPYSDDQAAAASAMWEAGKSAYQISQELGLNLNTLQRRLKEWGYEKEHRNSQQRGTRTTFAPEEEKEITRLYASGGKPHDIEQRFGCSRATLLRIVRRNGGQVLKPGQRRWPFSEEEVADAILRWEAGESITAISQALHRDKQTITRLLEERGVRAVKRLARGPRNPQFKGERIETDKGYILVRIPDDSPYVSMRMRNGYVPEHRLVMATKLGRPLKSSEHVHHIDGNRQHNDESNLQLIQRHHGRGVRYRCRCCGSTDVEAVPFAGEG